MPDGSIEHAEPGDIGETPFTSADEAWIWAVQGMQSRLSGANVKAGMARFTRPCEASDVLSCANRLHREGALDSMELRVLLLYGGYAAAPMVLGRSHAPAVPYWQRGMDALTPIMEQKGIIIAQRKARRRAH